MFLGGRGGGVVGCWVLSFSSSGSSERSSAESAGSLGLGDTTGFCTMGMRFCLVGPSWRDSDALKARPRKPCTDARASVLNGVKGIMPSIPPSLGELLLFVWGNSFGSIASFTATIAQLQ